MSRISRRKLLAVGVPLAATIASGAWLVPGNDGKKIIRITAQRFQYTPSTIVLRLGEPTLLELTSLDRMHGFYAPDLDVRADIIPGRTTHVPLTLEEIGEHDFLCDLFCGSGHGEMIGKIIVVV
jgi:cytochrome c oxidase subunit 2